MIARYYAATPYSDALGVALNNTQRKFRFLNHLYYHSGLRFRIDRNGDLIRQYLIDQGPIVGYQDRFDLLRLIYSIANVIYSLYNITRIKSILWLIAPIDISDHFPGDNAKKDQTDCHKKI